MTNSLPSGCLIRPATAEDIGSIRRLVFLAKLDPTQLRWSQFSVIEQSKKIIACGQLRCFQGAQELGSLVVDSAWRKQGLGSYLVKHLIATATDPIYLECLGTQLALFYSQLGFIPVSWQELPTPLKRKFGFSRLAATLFRLPLTIMFYDKEGKS